MQNQTSSNPNTLLYKPKSKIKLELKPVHPKYSSLNLTEKERTLPTISLFAPCGVSV